VTGGQAQPTKSGVLKAAQGGSPSGQAPLQAGYGLDPHDSRAGVVVVVVEVVVVLVAAVTGAQRSFALLGCTARVPN
jgi:hypothetical protein